jgi:ABC-2 type transport system ATP-binding protein
MVGGLDHEGNSPMHRPLLLRVATVAIGIGVAATAITAPAEAAPTHTVQTLHFAVTTGPNDDKECDIVGDLYVPTAATSTARVPAILTTNGFGGSKDDQAGIGAAFADRGYVVLSYSGLGFGGSDCKITLDDPDWDGKAASQLISYLGGASGIAFTDDAHTTPAPVLDVVKRDAKDHLGDTSTNDPRVGMVGGSYGGQIQFAAASVDPRLDTIVPIVTWNDLTYSLGPNNTGQTGVTSSTPGATKLAWGLLFSTLGMVQGFQNAQTDPSRVVGCPNFADFVCVALVLAGTTGYFDAASLKALRHASVANYMSKIKIPTLLLQGQNDTLFNLNESIATFEALRAQGTPVKLIWQSWGHSNGTPAPGEIDLGALNPDTQYETARVLQWFERYLKGRNVNTGPTFAYFRDWVSYSGIATPAYGTSSKYPVGSLRNFYLSGTSLATSATSLTKSTRSFLTPPAGLPTSTSEPDAIGSVAKLPVPELDLPGTFADWTSAPLTSALRVVGTPTLTTQVSAPVAAAAQSLGPAGQLVLFVRLQDVGTDGKAKDLRLLSAPIRIKDVTQPISVTLPAIVYQFAKGHRVRLVIAGGSLNYRGGVTPQTVQVTTGTSDHQLRLPAVP